MKKDQVQKGLKYDGGKDRWDLLPLGPVSEVVKILTFGASKYSDNSWQGVDNGVERYYAALMRHLYAWRSGEERDPESGMPHISHALTNLLFLTWFEIYGDDKKGEDEDKRN